MANLKSELTTAKKMIASTIQTLNKSQAFAKSETESLHKLLNKIVVLITMLADEKLDQKK